MVVIWSILTAIAKILLAYVLFLVGTHGKVFFVKIHNEITNLDANKFGNTCMQVTAGIIILLLYFSQ